jgi:formylglycine-generating enzyme
MGRLDLVAVRVCFYLALAGCQVLGEYEDFAEREPHPCDHLPTTKPDELGFRMLRIKHKQECFWIDETEVTVAQYRQFAESDEAQNQAFWKTHLSSCVGWKTGPSKPYPLDADLTGCEGEESGNFADDKPIRCIDWCDARAFCIWQDKDLCDATANDPYKETPSKRDEWGIACQQGTGTRPLSWPYGDTWEKNRCNIDLDADKCAPLNQCQPAPVTAFDNCRRPGELGPANMIGNVAEWVRPCEGPGDAGDAGARLCHYRGGSFNADLNLGTTVQCKAPSLSMNRRRSFRHFGLGFRCCAARTPAE